MLFELENVTKRYGPIVALNGLSVAMPEGAIGLLGPNGAGKTTLIRALLGLIALHDGRGKVLGKDIRRQQQDIRQAVGFVPEDECLFPGTVGVGFVAFAGELAGMPGKDALQRSHEVLDYVGLGEARYRPVESYSTGMKQRLKLAAALVHDPKLLILDEPTNGMDPAGREELLKLADGLAHHKGVSLLYASHVLPDVEAVCDQVLVMGRGKLLAQGKLADLKAPHDHSFELRLKADEERFAAEARRRGIAVEPQVDGLRVDLPQGQGPDLVWRTAADLGLQIRCLRPRRSTLEEVFLKAIAEQG